MKLTLILTFFFLSCNTQNSNNVVPKKITRVDSLKNKLLGLWGGPGEASPIWEIKNDSIYYYEEKKTYPYQIVDNDLVIALSKSNFVLKTISVVEDTMTFYDEQAGLTIKAYRFKTKK